MCINYYRRTWDYKIYHACRITEFNNALLYVISVAKLWSLLIHAELLYYESNNAIYIITSGVIKFVNATLLNLIARIIITLLNIYYRGFTEFNKANCYNNTELLNLLARY